MTDMALAMRVAQWLRRPAADFIHPDQSAFRIIQEALTNTLRHAGPAAAAVAVDYGRDVLQVEVTDTRSGLTSSAAEAAYASLALDLGFPVRGAVTFDPEAGTAAGGWGHG